MNADIVALATLGDKPDQNKVASQQPIEDILHSANEEAANRSRRVLFAVMLGALFLLGNVVTLTQL